MKRSKKEVEAIVIYADDNAYFYIEEWKETKAHRTRAQNNVFWRCFTLIGDKMGYKKEDVRDNCMKALFGVRETKFGGAIYENAIRPETSDLNNYEANRLIDSLIEFGSKLGIENMVTSREKLDLFNN